MSEHDGEVLDPQASGDSAEGKVTDEELEDLIASVKDVCTEAGENVVQRRELSHNTRFCFWDGQDESGRKLKDKNGGKEVFPFEGASDVRNRLADDLVGYFTGVLMAAATKASTRIEGLDGTDQGKAARLRVLLKWVFQNKLGRRFFRELVKACQYLLGDSPGVAVMGVYWKQEDALEFQEMSLEQILEAYSVMLQEQQQELTEADAAELMQVFADPEREEEAIARLQQLVPPTVTQWRLKKMAKELRETGATEYPSVYQKENRPEVCTHRLFEDVFLPSNCTDIQDAEFIHRRCPLTKAQVKTRARMEGWSDAFVEEVLKTRGETAFTEVDAIAQGISEITKTSDEPGDRLKNKYEIIYTHQRMLNDDGVPAIYETVWSATAKERAKDRFILDYHHGNYPYVEMPREILNSSLWDSRGLPEMLVTDQNQLKRQDDQFSDHSTLVTVPPFTVPRNRPNFVLKIAPLALVKEDRPGQVGPMKMMPYPRSADEYANRIMERVAKYVGYPMEGVPQSVVVAKQQLLVNIFLASLADIVRMVLQLCMQYMDPQVLARVMAGEGNNRAMEGMQALPQTPREIQNMFDVQFWLDVRTLDSEYVMAVAEAIGKVVLPMDTQNTAQRDKLVQMMFSMFDPQLADSVLQDVESVSQTEILDEELNFVKAYSGIEPEMAEDGQNFGLRAQWLEQRLQLVMQQPDVFPDPSPATQEIWQRRMQHLGFQVQQQENAQTGRVGVQQ